MKIRVNEIFDSIQGEGSLVGMPVTFVRLQGCNLRCPWCDTKHALDLTGGRSWDTDELVSNIQGRSPRAVVYTGGEPLLQREALREVVLQLKHHRYQYLETNGTCDIPKDVFFHRVVVSPKPPDYLIMAHRADEIKVVITDPKQLDHLHEWMPNNSTLSLQPVDNDPDITKACISYLIYRAPHVLHHTVSYRLSYQIHKVIGVQ